MTKRSPRQRLQRGSNGVRPCGCNAFEGLLCVQHLQAMTPAERAEWRRTQAARTNPPRDAA